MIPDHGRTCEAVGPCGRTREELASHAKTTAPMRAERQRRRGGEVTVVQKSPLQCHCIAVRIHGKRCIGMSSRDVSIIDSHDGS